MGLIERGMGMIFGGGRNLVQETVEVFRENSEAGAMRAYQLQDRAIAQYSQEFRPIERGPFDRFMDAINRLPRPALALGTVGLFGSAMANPLWFAERMQGIALVPDPLWWLLGVVVCFYFGSRHQVKSQEMQRDILASMSYVPQVMDNIDTIRETRANDIKSADTGSDIELSQSALTPDGNAALENWRRLD